MKRFLSILLCIFCCIIVNLKVQTKNNFTASQLEKMGYTANSSISKKELYKSQKILKDLQKENGQRIKKGYGPFLAVIYDKQGRQVAKMSNTVLKEGISNNHAEMNTIKLAEKNLNTFDLGNKNLTMYVTAEPCVMCMGAIMWSGINKVFYSVPSKDVEAITGFDEGYKPNWQGAMKNRGIKIYGNIESDLGKKVLADYKKSHKIYM